jgi:hypothetical protein
VVRRGLSGGRHAMGCFERTPRSWLNTPCATSGRATVVVESETRVLGGVSPVTTWRRLAAYASPCSPLEGVQAMSREPFTCSQRLELSAHQVGEAHRTHPAPANSPARNARLQVSIVMPHPTSAQIRGCPPLSSKSSDLGLCVRGSTPRSTKQDNGRSGLPR